MKRLQLVEKIFLRVLFGGKLIASERRHARSAINTTLRLTACMVLIASVSASHASGMVLCQTIVCKLQP